MNWDERQQAKRIETRRREQVGVPSDHFVPAPATMSRHRLRKARQAIRAAIAQRDAR